MFTKLLIKLIKFALQRADLSIEQRSYLTTLLLDKLAALPLRDIIVINEQGTLLVNGQKIDLEKARILQEAARFALNNQALKIIRDQTLYAAIVMGVHKQENVGQSFFSRAAIWWGQQEDIFLQLLAGEDTRNSPLDGD